MLLDSGLFECLRVIFDSLSANDETVGLREFYGCIFEFVD